METLEPLDSKYVVPLGPDSRETEFEVQAALFSSLRNNGFDVRGEVKWCGPAQKNARRETCRFDLVIYKDAKPVHIVEVKAAPMTHKVGVEATRQGNRYRHFGVPVTFVYGGVDALAFLQCALQEREHGRL